MRVSVKQGHLLPGHAARAAPLQPSGCAKPAISRFAAGRAGLDAAFRVLHHLRVAFAYHGR
jgi:hypothetical protein